VKGCFQLGSRRGLWLGLRSWFSQHLSHGLDSFSAIMRKVELDRVNVSEVMVAIQAASLLGSLEVQGKTGLF